MTQDEWDAHVFQYGERRDGLVWNARHGGADVLADDSNAYVLGPDMRAGDQWADAALVLTIETTNAKEAS